MNLFSECRKIKQSGLFDPEYYLRTYADVRKADVDPLRHFCKRGWKEGRNPSAAFNTRQYLQKHPELQEMDINPLLHHINSLEGSETIPEAPSIVNRFVTIIKSIAEDPALLKKFAAEVRTKGLKSAIAKSKFSTQRKLAAFRHTPSESEFEPVFPDRRLDIVPFYINPDPASHHTVTLDESTIAIHIRITDKSLIDTLLSRLSIGKSFDLYLSLSEGLNQEEIEKEFKSKLSDLSRISTTTVDAKMGSMESLLHWHKVLLDYHVIGHFHTDTTLCPADSQSWYEEALDLLLDLPGQHSQQKKILELLQTDGKIIYPESTYESIKDPTGWYGLEETASELLGNYTDLEIDDYETIDFPESGMFWAQSRCLERLLSLPVEKMIQNHTHQEVDQLLRQTLLLFAASCEGKAYRLHKDNSLRDYRYYEKERDFSETITHKDIKVLAYYLPQFHPIPENNEWHGKGFTEWTKVRGATPLFEGHYKQHIPHPDIGYYLLDSPDTLRMQAEMMHKSGVYGQIFYHYWFSGKLILEEPVKMLLDNPDIQMPYCFCWANENWTRRWDGDDEDVLLGQIYSREDARGFIRYLIPFFQDERYIRIDGRPALYIYRPASIPDIEEYLDVWEEECLKASLPKPYVVGVLTRGATDPNAFHLDAGTERVLHDWTDNAVRDIGDQLHHYHTLNTHILSYDEVASFYENQTEHKPFTYFRSLIATWDNTARYGKDAYLVHGSTPRRFQEWLEKLMDYSRETLEEEKRFIVVNAWNEWAEGAHLEPDTHYGYSYLNAIGRALSGHSYADELNASAQIPKQTKVHLSLSDDVTEALQSDEILKEQFLACLNHSTFLKQCQITTEDEVLTSVLPKSSKEGPEEADYILYFSSPALFGPDAIEKMLGLAFSTPESLIIPNHYSQRTQPYHITENGSVTTMALYDAPFVLIPKTHRETGYKNIRMRTDTCAFDLSAATISKADRKHVTTIVRLHKGADFDELKKALFSLAAMRDCTVTPLLAIQDLSSDQQEKLRNLLDEIPFAEGVDPQIEDYSQYGPQGDLRTLMMNDALKKVKTRYAAFLDYDDLLFPDAYAWLLERLEKTGKAVTFGRVYATSYNSQTGTLTKRERAFEYGYSYDDFIYDNHAPIHSFMLDLDQIDLAKIIYHEDQKYMEDYYLTLQIFTKDNTDWESLSLNHYIGDYIHSTDREHTLAIANEEEKSKLLDDPVYQRDEKRICDLRDEIIKKR